MNRKNILSFDPTYYPFSSRRNLIYATNGIVATSHPLAAQAGLDVLKAGGNAIDAAVATAITLTVAEPTSNGIGGDAFTIVWDGKSLHGLNGSGHAPSGISAGMLTERGLEEIPAYGWEAVTVPGVPATWYALSERFGKIPYEKLFEVAVSYAEAGIPIQPTIGVAWKSAFDHYSKILKGDVYKYWFETFAPGGIYPGIGEIWKSNGHADTLREIAETKSESFYRGKLAEKILDFSRSTGGYMSERDLEDFRVEWVEPVSVNYRGYDVFELPPNGQGLVTLMALNILNNFELGKNQVDSFHPSTMDIHRMIEAIKLSFADAKEYIADPACMKIDYKKLIEGEYGKRRALQIGERAAIPESGKPESGGTVYLATADRYGNMVSYIQSNYMGFGSGLVVPGTGIALHNRGKNFSLKKGHPNCIAPRKRPYHTIIPGFIMKDGRPVGPFGVMGGFLQPQGQLQLLVNTIDCGLNPQAALDAPRWQWAGERRIIAESDYDKSILSALEELGHEVEVAGEGAFFGRGQVILRLERGREGAKDVIESNADLGGERPVYCCGTEKRCDSGVASY